MAHDFPGRCFSTEVCVLTRVWLVSYQKELLHTSVLGSRHTCKAFLTTQLLCRRASSRCRWRCNTAPGCSVWSATRSSCLPPSSPTLPRSSGWAGLPPSRLSRPYLYPSQPISHHLHTFSIISTTLPISTVISHNLPSSRRNLPRNTRTWRPQLPLLLPSPPRAISPDLTVRSCWCRSLFERLLSCGRQRSMLRVQYRMHPAIACFPSRHFYEGALDDGVTAAQRAPPPGFPWPRPDFPVALVSPPLPLLSSPPHLGG